MVKIILILSTFLTTTIADGIPRAMSTTSKGPSMRDSLNYPIHVYEGDDALITCVVKNIGENSVMWRKEDRERHSRTVLTAGSTRVTADKRFSVLHDSAPAQESWEVRSGGDVWVLVIKSVKPSDSGIYVCEINSNPIVRSFHKLSVLSKDLQPPQNVTSAISEGSFDDLKPPVFSSLNHNYTDCCLSKNVTVNCLGFCNIQSILEGSTGQDPEHCEIDFPSIVKCMADGRNHVPCCIQERVPDICQDVCRGEYTAITNNIKTHFSCSAYTEQTLACIIEGIELLPKSPENLEVEAITEKSIKITWSNPPENNESFPTYTVNITALKKFDPHISESNNNTQETILIKVPAHQNQTLVNNLKEFTMYEITVFATNNHGSSLPTYSVRALTLTPDTRKNGGRIPQLPDTRKCCSDRGITQKTCLNKLCDPSIIDVAEITDYMICAPWAPTTFSCLADKLDHTACCKERGLPEKCQQFCLGNTTVNIDFNVFKCFRYMGEYKNCLFQGYGVLPSPPTQVHVTNIDTEFAILHWFTPKSLGDTVLYYNVKFRMLTTYDNEYRGLYKVHSPYILEGLESDMDYEFFIEAVNAHGVGEPSVRINFRTGSKVIEEEIEQSLTYNVTECCIEADLSDHCLPICSYNANMTDIKTLAGVCASEFHKIVRCGAGGRNHGSCCSRRGVPPACVSLCSGVIVDSLLLTATTCMPYIGNIALCFEEGTGKLPGPVSDLHADVLEDNSVVLEWEPPTDGSQVIDYEIHYQKVDNMSIHETLLKLDHQLNVTETSIILKDLEVDGLYHMFVVSRNKFGTSLPSSMLMIKVRRNLQVNGVTSPPHSLAVASHSATWVTISWQPPEFSHPSERIIYNLFYKSSSEEAFNITNTTVTTHMIDGLSPNTQYIVYVKAISKKGASLPSETLIAWTDPAYPAFVEPPTVHPINLVIEGSSMTILCIAMGTPMPTISLYITGRLVRQETTRHMVTVVHNVTRDMDEISCYADNGYGTPMQASKKITISHLPHIQASGITMAAYGDTVLLECKVDAHPEPKMIFWQDHEDRKPVIQGGKYDILINKAKDKIDNFKYIMQLTIKNIVDTDVGDYFCHAENAFGSSTQPVSVRIRHTATVTNITQCCIEHNVSTLCMDACSFYLDIDAVINKLECVNDFDKLIKCAADGSDHRKCCADQEVPRSCLDYCRGDPKSSNKACVLSYTKQIMNCFHENKDLLPGPPQNVKVENLDSKAIRISWSPPVKNPHKTEMYRVYWKLEDDLTSKKEDTKDNFIILKDLEEEKTYEFVVKAINHRGTSILSESIKFTVEDSQLTSTSLENSSHVGVAIGVILALIVVGMLIFGAFWFVRTKRGAKNQGGVAFENPSYLREVNMDHIQSQTDSSSMVNGISSVSATSGWKHEPLHVPSSHEVNPTLYEELKLGQDGVGFKRLKP
nr:Ig-like and fibronectin type-III domain-containing protein 2 [Onthophagus taurus]